MFKEVFWYELKYQFRLLSTHIYFGVLFLLSFLAMLGQGGAFTGVEVHMGTTTSGKVFVNSPYNLHIFIAVMGYIGIIFVAAIAARMINRDYEHKTSDWFYTLPLSKPGFVFGRFIASALVLIYILAAVSLGVALAANMPFVNADKFMDNSVTAYIYPILTTIIPYVIFSLGLFLATSLYFRNTLTLMISAIIILMVYMMITNLPFGLDDQYWVALIDPFSMFNLSYFTKYWTIAQKNSDFIPLQEVFLYNRLLLLGFSALVLGFSYYKFSFGILQRKSEKIKEDKKNPGIVKIPVPAISTGFKAEFGKFADLTKNNILFIVKSGPFIGLMLFYFVQMITNGRFIGNYSDTTVYPVTSLVARNINSNFMIIALALITIFAGEIVWRERSKKYDGIFNTIPVATWTNYLAKLASLILFIYILASINIIMGILIQASKGYFNFELGLYFEYFYLYAPRSLIMLALLSFVVHILVNHKFLSYLIVVLFYVSQIFSSAFDLDHPLYTFGSGSFYHSDISGFDYTGRFWILTVYWGLFLVLALIFSRLFWVRGNETDFKARIKLFKSRFNSRISYALIFSFVTFVATGSYIFYNTNIADIYLTKADEEQMAVDYEKTYKKFLKQNQPRIATVDVAVDLYPSKRNIQVKGYYYLKNYSNKPIDTLHVVLNKRVPVSYKFADGSALLDKCDYFNYQIYKLNKKILPGDSLRMDFEVDHLVKGFSGGGTHYNGTFINNFDHFPQIGYQQDLEIQDETLRKKYNLPAKERMPDLTDEWARNRNYVNNASWIDFRCTVSTDLGQTAIAPGRLLKKWEEGDRAYFCYKLSNKILNFFNINSARYEVLTDKWQDVDLEIFYHKAHGYNVVKMMNVMKTSLETFTRKFGPYQFDNLRIVEFPSLTFAQSFATTIPFSEKLGFIIDYDSKEEKGVDYLTEVTAHEIGHQWWAHQVITASNKGATMLTECLAQYSAYLVLDLEDNKKQMRNLRRINLDKYLRGRSREEKKELPLAYGENQGYLNYKKGMMAVAAIQHFIGEDSLNISLKRLLRDHKYANGPYTVSTDYFPYIKAVTPDSLQYLVVDLLEKMVLYDNKVEKAVTKKLADGFYETTIDFKAKKLSADELGTEKEIALNDYLDIGVVDKEGNPLKIKRVHVDKSENTIKIVSKVKPVKAGIDPEIFLIDKKLEDNLKEVKEI